MANVSGAVDVKLSSAATLALSVDHFRDDYRTAYWGTALIPATLARDASDVITDSRGYVLDKAMREVNFEVTDGLTKSHSTWLRARLDWRCRTRGDSLARRTTTTRSRVEGC